MADSKAPAAVRSPNSLAAVLAGQVVSAHLTPEASLGFVMGARHGRMPAPGSSELPALSKLAEENKKAHANAIQYWCEDNASSLAPQQHQNNAPPWSCVGPRWPLEADAAAAEDAVLLCSRVTQQCLSARRRSATQRFDRAVLALVKLSSYAPSAGALLEGTGSAHSADASSSLSSTAATEDGTSEASDDDTQAVTAPLTRDEAVRRYQDCCLVFSATPLPTVLERLRRCHGTAARHRDTTGFPPLSASLKGSSVMSSSERLSHSASTSLRADPGPSPHQLPGVDFTPTMPRPTALRLLGSAAETELSEGSDYLDVSRCPHLGEPDAFIPFLGFLHGLVYLNQINFSKTDLQNPCFSVLLLLCEAYLPNLEDLDVSYNVRLSDGCAAAVFHFLREAPQLHRLHVKGTAMRPATVARIERNIRRHSLPITLSSDSASSKKVAT